jgi:prephenate dehydrogenase
VFSASNSLKAGHQKGYSEHALRDCCKPREHLRAEGDSSSSNLPLERRHPNTETRNVYWKRITLIGVGLLGGSLGLALRQRHLAGSVVGFVRRAVSVREAVETGAVDSATRNLAEAVSGAELVVLCTPIAQMRPLVMRLLPFLQPKAIVTDVGSVKGSVVRELEPLVAQVGAHFVGSHPMAGAEKTGVRAAWADLFVDAVCVVTPTPVVPKAAVRKVEQLWKSVGSRLLHLTPAEHDELVSRSSHLPHLVAAELAHYILDPKHPRQQAALCANGFRDTTRIASSSPEMWRDIVLANRPNLLRALDAFAGELRDFRRVLKSGNAQAVSKFFERAKSRRDHWALRAGSTSPE